MLALFTQNTIYSRTIHWKVPTLFTNMHEFAFYLFILSIYKNFRACTTFYQNLW